MPKPGFTHVPKRNTLMSENPPSLVDLCVQTAIDNVRYLGDVGETDIHLLERILPHCTVDQLMHVENATKERDLSQATNKLWMRYYEKKFGDEHTNEVIEKLRRSKQKFTWKQLYEAKLEAQDLAQKESLERLRERYKKQDEQRQSRQIQLCSKTPPGKKRFFTGGVGSSQGYGSWNSSVSHVKSNIMKKAKIEYLNSQETKIRADIKKNAVQRSHVVSSTSKPVISPYKPGLSQSKPGGSQLRDSSSARTDLKSQGTTESKQGSLQLKGSSSSSSSSASASRYMQTDREDGVRRNPATSKCKATSLPPKSKNSAVAPRTTTEIDWDDDIKKKLSEFW